MEQALRESESRFRSLFDDSPISLWEEDFSAVKRRLDGLRADGVIDFNAYLRQYPEVVAECVALVQVLDVNKATLNLYGSVSKDDLVKNLATSLPKVGNEYFRDELVLIASGATHFEMEMIAQTQEGRVITVNLNWAVIPGYESDLSKTIVSMIDITERKLAEAELQHMKEGLLAANIELQTALARARQLAHTDALTGINNRRYLYELAEHEFETATRYQQPLSVLMFDVDDFKHINDTFGHAMGDQVLERVTQTVCAILRSADIFGRYGGDEFVILLPQTNAQEALLPAERIHASIAAMRIETDKGLLTVTISIGIAQTILDVSQFDTVEKLFLRADKALYAAKQAGRNCTLIYTGEMLTGGICP
jgi:diguanylate cyclase (GGDEF)-like protein